MVVQRQAATLTQQLAHGIFCRWGQQKKVKMKAAEHTAYNFCTLCVSNRDPSPMESDPAFYLKANLDPGSCIRGSFLTIKNLNK